MKNIHSMNVPHPVCICGSYEPKTTSGNIDTDCKKCNGTEPHMICGPDSCIHRNDSF